MNKFIMLNGKRSGSNNLMNSLHHLTRTKMVWMDSPPNIWKTFGLSFSNNEFYLNSNISNCLDEIFQFNFDTTINFDRRLLIASGRLRVSIETNEKNYGMRVFDVALRQVQDSWLLTDLHVVVPAE